MNPLSLSSGLLDAASAAAEPGIGLSAPAVVDPGAGTRSFADTLTQALDAVNGLQHDAQAGALSLANGTATNLHDVTIALEQANIALQLTATVRNRAFEAYQEVMRMTV